MSDHCMNEEAERIHTRLIKLDWLGHRDEGCKTAIEAAVMIRELSQATAESADIRWAVNVLLENIAVKFEGWDTYDIWRSDAANLVREFKHDLSNAPDKPDIRTPK